MARPRRYGSNAQRQQAYRQRHQEALSGEALSGRPAAIALPPLPAVSSIAGRTRWRALLQNAVWSLETVNTEMEGYFQERSERWQEDERGEQFTEQLEALEEVREALELFCQEHGFASGYGEAK